MIADLNREQIIDLLRYLGASKIIDKGTKDNIQFTCTVHGESNPSAGVSVSKQTYHCFSCHSSGSISWLVLKSLPDEFKALDQVDQFLHDRYGVDYKKFDRDWTKRIKRYDEIYSDEEEKEEERVTLPLYKLAPYKSGKETYQYFYDRGFTSATLKEYMIGRDIVNKTVTIPIFYEDNELAGVLGRYIDPNRPHNQRYKIYEFKTGRVLYPMHKLEVVDDTIILVEGSLDALYMHQLGFRNTLGLLTNNVSKHQAEFIKANCKRVIDMTDNDEMGKIATSKIKEQLKGLKLYTVKHLYPDGAKDPCDLDKETISHMLDNAKSMFIPKIRRIED